MTHLTSYTTSQGQGKWQLKSVYLNNIWVFWSENEFPNDKEKYK